jgi:hypothetical protein
VNSTADVAQFLGALRQKNRVVPIEIAEALLLIAAGIDNIPDLQRAMCDAEGNSLPPATVSRLIASLRGKARYHQGTWVESPYSLLDVRPHPHRRGLQLRLSAVGQELISAYFDHYKAPTNLVVGMSTCDEKSQCQSA